MGSQTPIYSIPYPVGTDRVMDGDNAMQAIAERIEAILSGSIGAPLGFGMWTDYAAKIVSGATSTTAAAGTSIVTARWMRIGKTLWVIGRGDTTTLVTGACVLLPNAAGIAVPGTAPRQPVTLHAGGLTAFGATTPGDQSFSGVIVGASADRVQLTGTTSGARDLAANAGIRWNLTYEVA